MKGFKGDGGGGDGVYREFCWEGVALMRKLSRYLAAWRWSCVRVGMITSNHRSSTMRADSTFYLRWLLL